MNTETSVPSEHLVELCPVTFLGSTASQEDGLIKVNAFHGTRSLANDDDYNDILSLDLRDKANRLKAAEHYGFDDDWLTIENDFQGQSGPNFFKIMTKFYAMRWQHARDTNQVVRINWAEEGQHRMFDWILIYTASRYTREQPHLVAGSIDENFLRNQGLADLEEFKSEAKTIETSTGLNVIDCIDKLLCQELSSDTYNPLLEPIKASFRTLRSNEEIDKNLSGRGQKDGRALINLLRNESRASKEDKRLSSHMSVSDVLMYATNQINKDIIERWQNCEPVLDREIFKVPISNAKNAALLNKLNDDTTMDEYRKLSPDPNFLKTSEMIQFIENPREHANCQEIAMSLGATPLFRAKEDGGDERWTKDEEDDVEYKLKQPPPPFMNTLDGMLIDISNNDLVFMNTQMVNFVLFFPVAMAATHNDTDSVSRIKETKYVLKHHLYPSKTQFNDILPVYELFFGNEKCKSFLDDTMVDTTTAIFFAMMMNAVLTFDSSLERFERMLNVIKTDETSLGPTKFKRRLGKNKRLASCSKKSSTFTQQRIFYLQPIPLLLSFRTPNWKKTGSRDFSVAPIVADSHSEKNPNLDFFHFTIGLITHSEFCAHNPSTSFLCPLAPISVSHFAEFLRMEKSIFTTMNKAPVKQTGKKLNFALQFHNNLLTMILYEAVKVYERHGLSPELNKEVSKAHWYEFGMIWEKAVRGPTASNDRVADIQKQELKRYIESYRNVGEKFNRLTTLTKVSHCDDPIRYALIMFNASIKDSKKQVYMKAGTYVGWDAKRLNFECNEDMYQEMSCISDILPARGTKNGPNSISFLEFMGVMFNCNNQDSLYNADKDHIKHIQEVIIPGHWSIVNEHVEKQDDEVQVVGVTSPTHHVKVTRNMNVLFNETIPKTEGVGPSKGGDGDKETEAQVETAHGEDAKAIATGRGKSDAENAANADETSGGGSQPEGANNKVVVDKPENDKTTTDTMRINANQQKEKEKEVEQTAEEMNQEAQEEIDADDVHGADELLPLAIIGKLSRAVDMSYLAGLADGYGSSLNLIKDVIVPREIIMEKLPTVHTNLHTITFDEVYQLVDHLGNKKITEPIVKAFKDKLLPISLGPKLVKQLVKGGEHAKDVEQFFTQYMPTMGWKYKASTIHDETGNYIDVGELPILKKHVILFFEENPCIADGINVTSETLKRISDKNDMYREDTATQENTKEGINLQSDAEDDDSDDGESGSATKDKRSRDSTVGEGAPPTKKAKTDDIREMDA